MAPLIAGRGRCTLCDKALQVLTESSARSALACKQLLNLLMFKALLLLYVTGATHRISGFDSLYGRH